VITPAPDIKASELVSKLSGVVVTGLLIAIQAP
jgi:hypothetical protein